MASPSVTYTFANSTTADATEVNTNFTDLINGASDGTKDYNINQLTCAGTVTLNGSITIGDATTDTCTLTATITSHLLPTTQTYNLGSTSKTWGSLYLDNAATDGGAIYFNSATTTYIKSTADGTQLSVAGATSLLLGSVVLLGSGKSGEGLCNVGLISGTTSVSGDSITISGADGSLSSTNPNYVCINSSATAGRVVAYKSTADVTINLTGAHWGAGTKGDLSYARLFVYAIDNNGSLTWGVSDDPNLESINTANGFTTASASSVNTSGYMLVSSALAATANWPCRRVGWFWCNFDDTGGSSEDLWTLTGSQNEIYVGTAYDNIPLSYVQLDTGNGFGSTDTKIRRFTNQSVSGNAIDAASAASTGDVLTINETGLYSIHYTDLYSAADSQVGLSLNSSTLTTSVGSIAAANRLGVVNGALNDYTQLSWAGKLKIGDRVRPHTGGNENDTTPLSKLIIVKMN